MHQLSDESARKYYSILLDIHRWDINFAIKVPIFKNLLEIGILNEVTGKNLFEDKYENNKVIEKGQKTCLQDNKEILDRFGDRIKGGVRKDLFTGIVDLFAKRNIAEHQKKIKYAVYLGTLNTIAETINCFSKIPIPNEINRILDGKPEQEPLKPKTTSNVPKNDNKLGKSKSIEVINKKLSLNINNSNSAYSSINALVSQWSFNIHNSHFNNDLYIILEDQDDKILYCFLLKKGIIENPEKLFNQRNDERRKNESIIIIPKNDKNFTNNWQGKGFQFIKYKILEISYQKL